MERKIIHKALSDFGYTDNAVNKMLRGVMLPTLPKAFRLEESYGIPIRAWKDMKMYVDSDAVKTHRKR